MLRSRSSTASRCALRSRESNQAGSPSVRRPLQRTSKREDDLYLSAKGMSAKPRNRLLARGAFTWASFTSVTVLDFAHLRFSSYRRYAPPERSIGPANLRAATSSRSDAFRISRRRPAAACRRRLRAVLAARNPAAQPCERTIARLVRLID